MKNGGKILRAGVFGAVLAAAASCAGPAWASDPFPGDDIAPPVNINIGMIYTQFSNAGSFGQLHGGSDIHHSTRFVLDATTLRYIRIFEVAGYEAGVQVYEPYVGFIGNQQLGINPAAATYGQSAYANLSKNSGFAEPNFSAFFWPINDPERGNYLVIAPWISPPVSSFNKNYSLNPAAQNVWQYEMEIGARTIVYGTPATQNVALSLWATGYEYGNNHNSAYVVPSVTIPAFGVTTQPAAYNATFHEQPTLELRAYLPYQIIPATEGFIAPGIYQSFGGKQTYHIHGGPAEDSGNRTNETQIRLVAGSFVTPRAQVLLIGAYDVAAHGQPLNRTAEVRLTVFF